MLPTRISSPHTETLYECLSTLTRLLAPFMPFVTEKMYQNLAGSRNGPGSVHLDDYPEADPSKIDEKLSAATRLAMRLSSLGRRARSKAGIKVRQPLTEAVVMLRSLEEKDLLPDIAAQVGEELNVRRVAPMKDETTVLTVEANLPLLGPKYGAELPDVIRVISELQTSPTTADRMALYKLIELRETVEIGGYRFEPDEVFTKIEDVFGFSVASDGGYAVAVSTGVTDELRLEGQARELVHRLQNMRREAGFDIADYIVTYYQGPDELDRVLSVHAEYVEQETLSRELVAQKPPGGAHTESHEVDGMEVTLGVLRVE